MGTYGHGTHFDSYSRRVRSFDTLNSQQESALALAWRGGDQRAGQRFIESNLKFVVAIAREYRRWNTPMDDLVQQGNVGLLKAAERFDPGQDNCLRTYAAYWIRAEIRDHVMRGYRIVRLGTTRTERRAIRAFRAKAVDTVEDLVAFSGMPEARCRMLLPLLGGGDRSLDHAPDGHSAMIELLPERSPSAEERYEAAEHAHGLRGQVAEALQGLNDRERHIVQARMLSDTPRTLEQLGQKMGVSRERVRQLEFRAKQKLRLALS